MITMALNDATTTIFIVIAIIVCLVFKWYRRPQRSPPGPRGIPLLGVLPFLGKWAERTVAKWSKTYGPVMSVRIGNKDVIILNDYESVTQALVKQHTIFSGRRTLRLYEPIARGYGLIFLDYGPFWMSQRRFGSKTFRGMGVGKKSIEAKVLQEVSYLNQEIQAKNGKPFDISSEIYKAICNNICHIIFGDRYEYNNEEFNTLMHTFLKELTDPVLRLTLRLGSFIFALKYFPPFSTAYNGFLKDSKLVLNTLGKIVDDHEAVLDEDNPRNFIDAFLKAMKEDKSEHFTKDQLIEYIRELFIAGTETTSSTLSWCLICLLHYPDWQRKLHKEIFEIIGSDGSVSQSHKSNMPYTNAFIHEVFRYRTLAPFSVAHKTNEDTEFFGFRIPKNAPVLPNLWAVHNDPSYWKEPDRFKPERFIDEKGNFVPSTHVIPFSIGPRRCIGEQLAQIEIFIFLVSMIQKFEFLPDPKSNVLPSIDHASDGTAFVPGYYKIIARVK